MYGEHCCRLKRRSGQIRLSTLGQKQSTGRDHAHPTLSLIVRGVQNASWSQTGAVLAVCRCAIASQFTMNAVCKLSSSQNPSLDLARRIVRTISSQSTKYTCAHSLTTGFLTREVAKLATATTLLAACRSVGERTTLFSAAKSPATLPRDNNVGSWAATTLALLRLCIAPRFSLSLRALG